MNAGGCLPPCERAQRVGRPEYYRVQKRGWQDCKWSKCRMCLASCGLRCPFIEVSKIEVLLCGIWS